MEDAATLRIEGKVAVTTDSFVVTPIFFKGGDIGKLSVCGTVNDILAVGGDPRYLTCGFILEEGLDFETLERVVGSMAHEAEMAGVRVVAGDTKVIEGKGGIYINTCGIGTIPEGRELRADSCEAGDKVVLSGYLGDHHACVLSARLNIANNISSDCASLKDVSEALFRSGVKVKTMRDVTRGGLATVLNELALASDCIFEIDETSIPVRPEVRSFCDLLGLDPLYMGNEGKMAVIVSEGGAEKALAALRSTENGRDAAIIGTVSKKPPSAGALLEKTGSGPGESGLGLKRGVVIKTTLGGRRRLDMLHGEGLPRIC
jgi:hydrogenase expression/formation protein HypE